MIAFASFIAGALQLQEAQQRAARSKALAQRTAVAHAAATDAVIRATALRSLADMISLGAPASDEVSKSAAAPLATTHAPLPDLRAEAEIALLQSDADDSNTCSLAPRGPLMYSLTTGTMLPRPAHNRAMPATPEDASEAPMTRTAVAVQNAGWPPRSRRAGFGLRVQAMRIVKAAIHEPCLEPHEPRLGQASVGHHSARKLAKSTPEALEAGSRLPAWSRVSAPFLSAACAGFALPGCIMCRVWVHHRIWACPCVLVCPTRA